MDDITTAIARYAAGLTLDGVPHDLVTAAKRHLVDTVACALGGAHCDAARIGLRIAAGTVPTEGPGRVLVHRARVSPEAAAFINGAMIRYLDFNDVVNGGHPSDTMGALFAVAEAADADGPRLLTAMIVAYEVATRLIAAMRLRERGWDQGFAIGLAAAAGTGHLLRLPEAKIAHALAITAVSNVPLRATRAGQLSQWKGAATAFAARNAVFAALLAGEGMTGPEAAFSGRHGVFEQMGGPFAFPPFDDGFRIADVGFKYWPVENNAQAAVWAAIRLRERIPIENIARIEIATNPPGWRELASEPAKWDPETRETADHSLPYVLARVLADGTLTVASFEPRAYLDRSLRPLMAKIEVRADPAIDALFPDTVLMRVRAEASDGSLHEIEIENPRGHVRNPMSDEEIAEKFLRLAKPVLGPKASAALDCLRAVEHEPSLGRLFALLEAA